VKHLKIAVISYLLISCLGCGSSGPPRLATVKVQGKLYIDDKPFGPCTLSLSPDSVAPAAPGKPPTTAPALAQVAADGSFTLRTYEDGDGAVPGTYSVTISPSLGDATSAAPPTTTMNSSFPGVKPAKATIPKEGVGSGLDIKLEGTGAGAGMPGMGPPG
jgi:hypothetical protein